jgi:hypothetical protein
MLRRVQKAPKTKARANVLLDDVIHANSNVGSLEYSFTAQDSIAAKKYLMGRFALVHIRGRLRCRNSRQVQQHISKTKIHLFIDVAVHRQSVHDLM